MKLPPAKSSRLVGDGMQGNTVKTEHAVLPSLKAGRITGGTAGNEVFCRQSLPGLAGICSGQTSRSMQHSTSTGR